MADIFNSNYTMIEKLILDIVKRFKDKQLKKKILAYKEKLKWNMRNQG